MNINEIIKQLVKKAMAGEQIYCVAGEVVSVDTSARTCEVKPQQSMATIPAARLQSIEASNLGICLFPAVASQVIVAFIDRAQAVVVATSEIEDGEITMNDLTVSLNDLNMTLNDITGTGNDLSLTLNSGAIDTTTNFSFDGGVNGGLVIISALVTQLNALVAAINANVAIFNSHVHAPPVPGPPIPTTPENPVSTFNPVPWTNTKVQH